MYLLKNRIPLQLHNAVDSFPDAYSCFVSTDENGNRNDGEERERERESRRFGCAQCQRARARQLQLLLRSERCTRREPRRAPAGSD